MAARVNKWSCTGTDCFVEYTSGGCKDRNELGSLSGSPTKTMCAQACAAKPSCISFERKKIGATTCTMSSTCTYKLSIANGSSYNSEFSLYVKTQPKTPKEPFSLPPAMKEGRFLLLCLLCVRVKMSQQADIYCVHCLQFVQNVPEPVGFVVAPREPIREQMRPHAKQAVLV